MRKSWLDENRLFTADRIAVGLEKKQNSVFSLTWPASMQIYWNKRKRLHKKRTKLCTVALCNTCRTL